MHVGGEPDPEWNAGFSTCTACRALGLTQQQLASKEEKEKVAGVVPQARHWRTDPKTKINN